MTFFARLTKSLQLKNLWVCNKLIQVKPKLFQGYQFIYVEISVHYYKYVKSKGIGMRLNFFAVNSHERFLLPKVIVCLFILFVPIFGFGNSCNLFYQKSSSTNASFRSEVISKIKELVKNNSLRDIFYSATLLELLSRNQEYTAKLINKLYRFSDLPDYVDPNWKNSILKLESEIKKTSTEFLTNSELSPGLPFLINPGVMKKSSDLKDFLISDDGKSLVSKGNLRNVLLEFSKKVGNQPEVFRGRAIRLNEVDEFIQNTRTVGVLSNLTRTSSEQVNDLVIELFDIDSPRSMLDLVREKELFLEKPSVLVSASKYIEVAEVLGWKKRNPKHRGDGYNSSERKFILWKFKNVPQIDFFSYEGVFTHLKSNDLWRVLQTNQMHLRSWLESDPGIEYFFFDNIHYEADIYPYNDPPSNSRSINLLPYNPL